MRRNQRHPWSEKQMDLLSTADVARTFGVRTWQIQRLFEQGDLPEPQKFAGRRAIPRSSLPQIVDALRRHDWLSAEEAATA